MNPLFLLTAPWNLLLYALRHEHESHSRLSTRSHLVNRPFLTSNQPPVNLGQPQNYFGSQHHFVSEPFTHRFGSWR